MRNGVRLLGVFLDAYAIGKRLHLAGVKVEVSLFYDVVRLELVVIVAAGAVVIIRWHFGKWRDVQNRALRIRVVRVARIELGRAGKRLLVKGLHRHLNRWLDHCLVGLREHVHRSVVRVLDEDRSFLAVRNIGVEFRVA